MIILNDNPSLISPDELTGRCILTYVKGRYRNVYNIISLIMAFNCNFVSIPVQVDSNVLRWTRQEDRQTYRNSFSKDRDRILYSNSFLRLRGKTQVFMLQKNDYIRTRMTHTLEVNQLAKTIASALGQNIDLVEAIALGHDIGHTPFGHIGERTIDGLIACDVKVPQDAKGFKHNLQALRLLCDLEKGADYPEIHGLNLTKYTLWGVSHHSSVKEKTDNNGNVIIPIETSYPFYDSYLNQIDSYWSFEGYIVAIADEIAQRHHDIEDSLRFGIVDRKTLLNEIKKFEPVFSKSEKECLKRLNRDIGIMEDTVFHSLFARLVINLYVTNVITHTKNQFRELETKYGVNKQIDYIKIRPSMSREDYSNCVSFSSELKPLDESFQDFLKTNVLHSFQAQAMDGKASYIIKKLFSAFTEDPTQLPDSTLCSYAVLQELDDNRRETALQNITSNECLLHRCIADYIGGMTDQFAYDEFDRLYGTRI